MAKSKFKTILKSSLIGLVLAGIGVAVWQGIEHKDIVEEKWNNFWGIEQPAPDNTPTPDDGTSEEKPLTCAVTFVDSNITRNIAVGAVVEPPEASPDTTGKTFIGWAIEGTTEVLDLANYTFTEDTRLVAIFEEVANEVTFETGEGVPITQSVPLDGILIAETPTAPIKDGYSFIGWAIKGTSEVLDLSTYVFTESTTLVPIYIESDENVETTSASLFTFDNGAVTGYIGTESDIVIPRSYSLGDVVQETKVFTDYFEFLEYLDLNTPSFAVAVTDAESNEFEISTSEELSENEENIVFPVNAVISTQTYTEGNDIEVTTIAENAFLNNATVSSVRILSNIKELEIGSFQFCQSLKNVVMTDFVTNINSYAFFQCSNLETVQLSKNITSFGYGTFSGCSSLTNIIIPEKVVVIGEQTFSNCSNLTDLILPSEVESIGKYAFRNCTSLESLIIPENVTSIGKNAFNACTNLTLIFETEPTGVDITAMSDVKAIYVPTSCYETLINGEWTDFADKVFIKEDA